jgi:hypothetical protein
MIEITPYTTGALARRNVLRAASVGMGIPE